MCSLPGRGESWAGLWRARRGAQRNCLCCLLLLVLMLLPPPQIRETFAQESGMSPKKAPGWRLERRSLWCATAGSRCASVAEAAGDEPSKEATQTLSFQVCRQGRA